MSSAKKFTAVFTELVEIMRPFSDRLECVHDKDAEYYLNTHHIMKNGKPLFFGAVQIRKNYVSYHLMPVYVFPELLDDLSAELRKRMQGKSCFNFRTSDPGLFRELKALTSAGYNAYEKNGYV